MNPIKPFPAPWRAAGPSQGGMPPVPAAHRPALAVVRLVLFLILADAASGSAPVPAAGPAAAANGTAALAKLMNLIGPDYKKAEDLPDTFFNPFKVEATMEMTLQKRSAAVTEQGVAEAVGRKGVSGIIYADNPGLSQVIIGDQVFRVGDELSFPDGEGGAMAPLVAGATVILREVGAKNLVFDFTAEGESARRSSLSLRSFWAP